MPFIHFEQWLLKFIFNLRFQLQISNEISAAIMWKINHPGWIWIIAGTGILRAGDRSVRQKTATALALVLSDTHTPLVIVLRVILTGHPRRYQRRTPFPRYPNVSKKCSKGRRSFRSALSPLVWTSSRLLVIYVCFIADGIRKRLIKDSCCGSLRTHGLTSAEAWRS